MKDYVLFPSQNSKIIYNSDVIIFFMSQFELVLQCPSGSLEHFRAHAVVHVEVPLSAMQNKTQYELILKPTIPVLVFLVLASL